MRPVERGAAPKKYRQYGDAIGDLAARLGRYCSYCERRLPVSLAVEHMAPKDLHPDRELEWDNFLLGCTNCNSVKDTEDVADEDVLWPDQHNTILAIAYWRGGFVGTAAGLGADLERRARRLIDLVGLDRHGAAPYPAPAEKDNRWAQRDEIWAAAELCRSDFEALGQTQAALSLVVLAARGWGFFFRLANRLCWIPRGKTSTHRFIRGDRAVVL